MKVGIVFYSRTGNTGAAAQLLKNAFEETASDVELVAVRTTKRPGFFAAARMALKQTDVSVENEPVDCASYDLVVAGVPVWGGRPAPYVRAFMTRAENVAGARAAVFATCGGKPDGARKAGKMLREQLAEVGMNVADRMLLVQMRKGSVVESAESFQDFVSAVSTA
jgi:flavodoxin